MAALEMSHVDLECGRRSSGGGAASEETAAAEEEGSVCFSDADEGSCNSQFYSTADGEGSYDDYSFENLEEPRRDSSAADSSEYMDIENGLDEKETHLESVERDCRICHLSLVSCSPGSGIAIELGCCCKDDLAAAHKHCAETWFKIKGNKTCEICNSIARNVVGLNDMEAIQQASESSSVTETATSALPLSTIETRSCLNGHRFLNFLLACMVFAFVISWLFHFSIPS
ncbi:hypothetical protein BUALT_Bualt09G0120200 [Buddleja alternifolia]|uniref:RING-CH-type domain-containing protein n=1 Tax=Buddleja alternifolia TaxID=168488 RepID=A0AAV6XCI8_9LAMI|nr:hypothetical protein BUALT_Bualt09G0120200 [Buddleja alternifolia]